MRQEQAIRAFRKGLENAINQLTATSYSAIFGFIEPGIVALNDIQLKKDADAETLAEIEALKNKLVAIANSADKLWMNLSGAQDRLVGALRSMNNLSSELIAHADVNKDVFADSEARTMKD